MNRNFWTHKKICVTGGAALIGTELIKQLIELNPRSIVVADNFSSGKLENIPNGVNIKRCDLREWNQASDAIYGSDIVFHLACIHGGRAFVDTHEIDCYDNLSLDSKVFRVCAERGVDKVIFASSACVYPIHLQQNINEDLKLNEALENYDNPAKPDGAYGWAKLSAEKTLNAYVKAGKLKGVSTRFFTVYGEGVSETHAIGAMIMKSFMQQEPFEVFGDGNQKRNWTYVKDTVRGMILAAENLNSGYVNIGEEQVNTPNSALNIIWDIIGWKPNKIKYLLDKPVGILNRVADATKAKELLGWQPQFTFRDGLKNTIDWYSRTQKLPKSVEEMERRLFER